MNVDASSQVGNISRNYAGYFQETALAHNFSLNCSFLNYFLQINIII
jgi:hypothetical protein